MSAPGFIMKKKQQQQTVLTKLKNHCVTHRRKNASFRFALKHVTSVQ